MAYLDNKTHKDYYQGPDHGSYQFCTLEDIINQFMAVYVGEDKIIPRAKRLDVAFHAQRALAELSFDTLKSFKSQQIDIPPSMVMILPHDYVNYTKLSWTDDSGIKHPLYETKHTSNPFQIRQNSDGQYVFDPEEELIVNNLFSDALAAPWYLSNPSMGTSRTTWEYPRNTGNIISTGYSGVAKGSNITINANNQLSFNHSSHGSHGAKHGKAMIAFQEIDVDGIEFLNVTASANTQAATVTHWDLMSNPEKFTAGQDLDRNLFYSGYRSIIDKYNAGHPSGSITQTINGTVSSSTTVTLDSLEPIVSITVNGATGTAASATASKTVVVDSATGLEVGMRITATSGGTALGPTPRILIISGTTLTLDKAKSFADGATLTCKGPANNVIVGSTITAVSGSDTLSGTPTVTAINGNTITMSGAQSFTDGGTLTFSAAYDEDLLKSTTNSELDSDVPATTVRIGICTQVTDEMKTNTFIGDTTYTAVDPGTGQTVIQGYPMSPNVNPDIFDLQTVLNAPSYVEWSEGVDNGEQTLEDVNVANYSKVYFVVVSMAPFETHAYTGELGVLTTENTVDDISVKSSGVSVLKSPSANITESSTWKNYKTDDPSENERTDYNYDDDYRFNIDVGQRYGLDPTQAQTNGSFYIDQLRGKIHFSSNVSGKTVILDYISDGLGTEAEMQVHKLAEDAMYKHILCDVMSSRANVPANAIFRYKKDKFAATRKAKIRLSNFKIEELTQILRGKSKHIKH